VGQPAGRRNFHVAFNSNGVFVVDGVVGDYLCQKYGDIEATPLTIEIENNRIRNLQCENKELLEEFRAYTSTDENSNRVGEFAVGTNTACTRSSATSCRTKRSPASTLPSAIPTPSTRNRPGFPRRTSTASAEVRHLVRRQEGDGSRQVPDLI
jgi:hypothetical protein